MKVTIEVLAGANYTEPCKEDIDVHIYTIDKLISKGQSMSDTVSLLSVKSILDGIRKQLP